MKTARPTAGRSSSGGLRTLGAVSTRTVERRQGTWSRLGWTVAALLVLFVAYVAGRAAGILLDLNPYATEVAATTLAVALLACGRRPAGATGATRAHAYRAHPDDRAREATELVPLNRARSASAREAVTGRSRYRRRFATAEPAAAAAARIVITLSAAPLHRAHGARSPSPRRTRSGFPRPRRRSHPGQSCRAPSSVAHWLPGRAVGPPSRCSGAAPKASSTRRFNSRRAWIEPGDPFR